MPLEKDLKDIRSTEKEWKEEKETKTKLEEWTDLIKESDLTDKIKDLFSPGKDEDWTEEEKHQLDDVLEKAPPLQKDMQIYVNMQDNNITKNEEENIIKNEFYTRGNEGNINGAIDTVKPGVNFVTLTVPKGEKMAYIEEGARSFLLLRREVAYDITKIVHVSDDSGNPHIKYEAELVLQEEKALDFKNDVEKARKWGEDYYQRWKPELSQEEIQLIEKYTGGGYNEINAYLSDLKKWEVEYGKGSKDKQNLQKTNIQKKIEGIDAAINKTSVPDAMFVYRRVSEWQFGREAGDLRKNTDNTLNATILEEIIKTFSGQTFKQEGYMSTSLAKDPDKSFSGNRYNILLVVHIPKGTHAAYVANMTKYPEQLELLLQRGYTFKYDKFSVIKDEKFQESLRVDISLYNPTS